MTESSSQPVLYLIVCGGRPAIDLHRIIPQIQKHGWDVCVIATPSALKFVDIDEVTELTRHVVRYDYKQPEEPDVLPPPNALLVAPASFNTVNKWAHGISDTLALGILNEAIGLDAPIVAVPFPSLALAKHPAFLESVSRLRSWSVTVLFDPDRYPLPIPNMGPDSAKLFPWEEAIETISARLNGNIA